MAKIRQEIIGRAWIHDIALQFNNQIILPYDTKLHPHILIHIYSIRIYYTNVLHFLIQPMGIFHCRLPPFLIIASIFIPFLFLFSLLKLLCKNQQWFTDRSNQHSGRLCLHDISHPEAWVVRGEDSQSKAHESSHQKGKKHCLIKAFLLRDLISLKPYFLMVERTKRSQFDQSVLRMYPVVRNQTVRCILKRSQMTPFLDWSLGEE